MDIKKIKGRIKQSPKLKKTVYALLMHPVKTRPRRWVRIFLQPFYIRKGKKSVIYRSVRKDIVPFNYFSLGDYSVIEDFATVNNAVGDVRIGNRTRIGLNCVLIGPIQIGNNVNLAQGITVSGLNHKYSDVNKTIQEQGVSTRPIIIEDDVLISANSVIVAGVRIGKHSVIGGGGVVTKDIPSYSLAVGNPAKVIKKYDFETKKWVRINKNERN